MNSPESMKAAITAIDDLELRKAVWLAFSDLFLDTDVTLFYDNIVNVCAASGYSIDELAAMLKNEVAPACAFNLQQITGEWAGFDENWLFGRIIKITEGKQTFVRKLFAIIGDSAMNEYVEQHWDILSKKIQNARRVN